MIWPNVCHAVLISGELHASVPPHHWSYLSAPAWRSTMSSSQSVPGQPLAAPLSKPIHHGVAPESEIFWDSCMSSSQVLGFWLFEKRDRVLALYQMDPLTAALIKMPTSLLFTVPRPSQSWEYSALSAV